ncbi:DEAD/DEAH box helicase [Singulisphaera acidiphila]|uniref:Lhr-like helicase n=1 Tax=Singulisphaera acidiphila (strain ATCC BAA-1392 / DSM 18658 / VKM B-2454 / MOB10) TaxID=886293 RepID=L0DAN0_SINAD|nr:DEAD/DEAH box helicase [Singulisphaera acidiphila]AGA26312.1 Lhr-like helicase [Singulisphaera acidiphila DSM 18658]
MCAFDQLHPALRHQVVNSMGWRSLRPVQELAIEGALAGDNLLILAPTAGGKTEAAFFPLISETLSQSWTGLSVLYISPIKALLNNQNERLERYYGLVGRQAALWHGDVSASIKKHTLANPPDCLLTTPESLEVMLTSTSINHNRLFANVQAVVVDEVHAFARDDRGWHLLALLQRIGRLAGRDHQRIGLSATVGNEDDLLTWLSAGSGRSRRVIRPPAIPEPPPEVQLDYVGNLDNAATVIAALHRGEKRLVFCDSRSRVEQLAAELRMRRVETFVSHSSLGLDERQQAERAFAQGRDCVIVATSTLELGIDVGDLDRVVQIDAPGAVSSFLQRMGRTGRRPGMARNCLFLATSDESLLRAAGLIDLWASGFVDPATAPPEPLHILAQQLLALALQERGIGRGEWLDWVGTVPAFRSVGRDTVDSIVAGMIEKEILWDEAGVLWLGREGQDTYGRKNFLQLISVFTAPPLFTVLHGRRELGSVDESTFLTRREDGLPVLLLAGRAWRVTHLDWKRRRAYVEPAEDVGRSRWRGEGQFLSGELCEAIRRNLAGDEISPRWSVRTVRRMEAVRNEFPWLTRDDATMLVTSDGDTTWWTFGGGRANAALAHELGRRTGDRVKFDNFAVRFPAKFAAQDAETQLRGLADAAPGQIVPPADEQALDGLKFSECLPSGLASRVVQTRLSDIRGVAEVLERPMRIVHEC